jgi:DNA (cytosine-5)-methyltransferase 1
LKYLSVCSGIEAATVAWHPLGWEAVAYSEIERFPSEVLAHHYPNTPNVGDMIKFKEWNLGSNVDLLVGGTPCQSFSVAGLRKGLDDPRGNLMLTYLAIAKQYRPNWLVWENVPGVLSSNGGRDFGSFLGGLAECGYGFAYRVLDAQFFGVAQRRRRVFVVGYLGDWRAAAAVLFERHSLQGHPAPSREKREEVAGTIAARFGISRNNHEECVTWPAEISSTLDTTFGTKQGLENQHVNAGCPMFVPAEGFYETSFAQYKKSDVGGTIKASGGVMGGGSETFLAQPAYGIPGNWIGRKPENGGNATEPMYEIAPCLTKADQHGVAQPIAYNIAPGKGALKDDIHVTDAYATKTLDASGSNPAMHQGGAAIVQPISFSGQMSNPQTDVDMTQTLQTKNPMAVCLMDQGGSVMNIEHDMTGTLRRETHGHEPVVMQSMAVRRLSPKECERLQGFPDNYTNIKEKCPDGPRYKALGNSMAVPVMAWIGARIQQYEDMH